MFFCFVCSSHLNAGFMKMGVLYRFTPFFLGATAIPKLLPFSGRPTNGLSSFPMIPSPVHWTGCSWEALVKAPICMWVYHVDNGGRLIGIEWERSHLQWYNRKENSFQIFCNRASPESDQMRNVFYILVKQKRIESTPSAVSSGSQHKMMKTIRQESRWMWNSASSFSWRLAVTQCEWQSRDSGNLLRSSVSWREASQQTMPDGMASLAAGLRHAALLAGPDLWDKNLAFGAPSRVWARLPQLWHQGGERRHKWVQVHTPERPLENFLFCCILPTRCEALCPSHSVSTISYRNYWLS